MSVTALLDGRAAELEAGTEFTTRGRTITEGDLTSFSALTGDWHPQHADAEWAARSRFGARVAHGMLVLSYAIGLVPFDPERVVALRGLESATFKRPVAIGDTIRVRGRVAGRRALDDGHALVELALRVVNQDGRAVALARVEAVCREGGGEEPAKDDEAAAPPADGRAATGPWAGESLDLYGEEVFL